jgi:hypothetical protein
MNRHSVPNATVGFPGRPANGGSNPRFYDFDDGVARLVKWSPSPHGNKACFNELVASRLGQLIDAPILRGIVVYVPDQIIPSDHRGIGATPGFHFAVTRMEGENFVPPGYYNQYLQRLEYEDQHGMLKKTKKFKLIDMGQMFGDFNWTAASVANVHATYQLPIHMIPHLTKVKLAPAVDQLAQLPNGLIEGCFEDCPDTWGISQADKAAGAQRAIQAKRDINDILFNGNPGIQ